MMSLPPWGPGMRSLRITIQNTELSQTLSSFFIWRFVKLAKNNKIKIPLYGPGRTSSFKFLVYKKISYMFLLSASPRCLTTTRDARVRLSNERLPVGIVTCWVCWGSFFLVPRGDVGPLGNKTLVLVTVTWLQHVINPTGWSINCGNFTA